MEPGYASPSDQLWNGEGVAINTEPQDGKQHQDGACHGVKEELNGCIHAPRTTPDADQEIHRHQGELPEDVEEEKVLG